MADTDGTPANELGLHQAAAPEPTPQTADSPPVPEPTLWIEPSAAVEQEPEVTAEAQPEIPDDLLAVQAALEQPTGELMAITAAEAAKKDAAVDDTNVEAAGVEPTPAPGEIAAAFDQIAPGTIATEPAEGDEGETSGESATGGEGEAAEGGEGAAEAVAEGEAAESDAESTSEQAVAAAEDEGEESDEEEPLAIAPKTKVSWWPFVAYIVVWLGVAGYAVWQLRQLPPGQAAYETDFYSMSIVVGLSLLAAGPALILIVWFASWIGRKNCRIGSMFISALLKGATATLLGAVIWIGAIMLTDYLRLGRPF